MDEILTQLKAARIALGMKQFELGSKLGLPQSHVSSIENGKSDPRLSTTQDMARILDHELMLIPRELIPHVNAMIRGTDHRKPRWTLNEGEDA